MATHTNEIVPPFDFTPALRFGPDERMRICVDRIRDRHLAEGSWDMFGVPPIPDNGASETELRQFEAELGVPLPAEYRAFLRYWRYLILDNGLQVWGFDHGGISVGRPWVSDQHREGVRYLVFGDYWVYGDGDQLLVEVDDPEQSVVDYLHERGPLYETFAPGEHQGCFRSLDSVIRGTAQTDVAFPPTPGRPYRSG